MRRHFVPSFLASESLGSMLLVPGTSTSGVTHRQRGTVWERWESVLLDGIKSDFAGPSSTPSQIPGSECWSQGCVLNWGPSP